jgi:hypothetical protein
MEHTNPGMPKVNRPTEFQIRRTETECPDVELVAVGCGKGISRQLSLARSTRTSGWSTFRSESVNARRPGEQIGPCGWLDYDGHQD